MLTIDGGEASPAEKSCERQANSATINNCVRCTLAWNVGKGILGCKPSPLLLPIMFNPIYAGFVEREFRQLKAGLAVGSYTGFLRNEVETEREASFDSESRTNECPGLTFRMAKHAVRSGNDFRPA